MLTPTIMAGLALAVLWVNVLLIVGAAVNHAGRLGARLRRVQRAGREGSVATAGLAFVVEQTGHRTRDPIPTIAFHDRGARSEVGGALSVEGDAVTPPDGTEVWVGRARCEAAGRRGSLEAFEAGWAQARRAKGWRREVRVALAPREPVWWVPATHDVPAVVATMDPGPVLRTGRRRLIGFALGLAIAAAGVTALCLAPPAFGALSQLGALAGLALFLGMQPLGVMVRDAARVPAARRLGGRWCQADLRNDVMKSTKASTEARVAAL